MFWLLVVVVVVVFAEALEVRETPRGLLAVLVGELEVVTGIEEWQLTICCCSWLTMLLADDCVGCCC